MGSVSVNDSEKLQRLVQELVKASERYDSSPGPAGYVSRTDITQKAKEIQRLMMDPTDLSMYYSTNITEIVALRTMMKLNVIQSIPKDGSISLQDLSKATTVQESRLERQLRLLVGTGFLDQNEEYEYRHTRSSEAFCKVPGPGQWFQFMHDEFLNSMIILHSWMTDVRGKDDLREPDDPYNNPYTHRHGQNGTPVWEIMAQFPDRLKTFQLAFSAQEESVPIMGFYDYASLFDPEKDGDRKTVVDVGGGQGQSILQILKAHPSLEPKRMVLQDLDGPIEQVKAAGTFPPDATAVVHDFWTPQPIKGAKAYLLRRVMHDYSDENCVTILRHLTDAMQPDSKVLILDMVMPKRVYEADLPAAAMDNTVMVMGGKERSEEGFKKILDEAGLTFIKTHRSREGGSAGALVEAGLKQQ